MVATKSTARRTAPKAKTEPKVMQFDKSVVVPVPCGTVDWMNSDHAARIAEIRSAAEEAGWELLSDPAFKSEESDPDNPYTGTVLTYSVEAKR